MKAPKRITALFLTLILTLGLFAAIPITASAEGDDTTLGVSAVTFDMPLNDSGETAFYLPENKAITDTDLLAGVSSVDETGAPVAVTVQSVDGLDMQSPQMRGAYPNPPYIITYSAAHPTTGKVFTATRELYITLGLDAIVPLAVVSGVSYQDADGTTKTADNVTEIDSTNIGTINDLSGWYIVKGTITCTDTLTVNGTANLILADNCELSITDSGNGVTPNVAGINVTVPNSLTIYAQSNGSNAGKLNATASWGAGIGGNVGEAGGSISIYGGVITANGDGYGAGIGGGGAYGLSGCDGGTIVIGGSANVTAIGGPGDVSGGMYGGAGIGGGNGGAGGDITISGGKVQATGQNGGAGIGGGSDGGAGGDITISGNAKVDATGGKSGAGIGGGSGGDGGDITISGGAITAEGGIGGAGIGGGNGGNGGAIDISGGTIMTQGGYYGAGIGGGYDGDGGAIDISGGAITAEGGEGGAGIGGGYYGDGGTINITGGAIAAQGGDYGAGIGGGSGGDGGTINITGGTGTATGRGGGAGIGGGDGGAQSTVNVDPNTITSIAANNGVTNAAELDAALSGASDGDTIKLLDDITYNNQISLDGKVVTLELNGNTLTVDPGSGNAMEMTNNALIEIHGSGTCTIDGNITATSDVVSSSISVCGVSASYDAAVTVKGNITVNSTSGDAYGVNAQQGATVTVTGDVTAAANYYAFGVMTIDAEVTVGGSVTATAVDYAIGVYANNGAEVTIEEAITVSGSATMYITFDGYTETPKDPAMLSLVRTDYFEYTDGDTPPTYVWVRDPATLKFVSVGSQSGPLTAGTAGTVTFPVTTASIAGGDYAVSVANLPAGVTVQGQVAISGDSGTLTLEGDTTTPAGTTNNLTLTIDGATSAAFTLTIDAVAPPVTFTAQGSGINLNNPSDLVFVVDNAALLSAYDFLGVRFMNVTTGSNYGQTLMDSDGVTYVGGMLTVPAAAFGTHGQQPGNNPLKPGTYRAEITFGDGMAIYINYYAEFSLTNGYTLTVVSGSGSGDYEEGTQVPITADAAPSGKVFDKWTGGDGGLFANTYGDKTTFTMPDNPATVTATYKDSSGNYTPPPSSNDSDSSGGSSSSSTTPTPAGTWLERDPAADLAKNAKGRGQDYARTRITGIYGVRGNAWDRLAGLRYEHDTMDGGVVQVRLYVDNPEKLTKDIRVSGYVKGFDVDWVKAHFEKWYKNKLQAIHFDHQGAWGQTVSIAAKIDLTGMDTNNLCFYSYDKKANQYKRIEKPAYWIDKNGYLHFTTGLAGDIIISEGQLERK